jgi:hypothetical protein
MFAAVGKINGMCEGNNFHVLFPSIDVVVATGTGDGAWTVTLTINDGTNPLQNARVRMTSGMLTYLGMTDVNGHITFNLDSATWTIGVSLAGYSFAGAQLVVAGNTTHTYSLTPLGITPSGPGTTTGYLTCFGPDGNVLAGVSVTATVQTQVQPINPTTDFGNAYNGDGLTAVSDINGLVQFPNMFLGVTYMLKRANGPKTFAATIPGSAGSTYALPSIIGKDAA